LKDYANSFKRDQFKCGEDNNIGIFSSRDGVPLK
jgi:hypothetical protein